MSDVAIDVEALVRFVGGRGQRYWLAPGLYDANSDDERVDDLLEYFLKNQEFYEEMLAMEGLLANIQAMDDAGEQALQAMRYAVSQATSISESVVFELPTSSTSFHTSFIAASKDNSWLSMLQQWGFALHGNFVGLLGEDDEEDEDDDEKEEEEEDDDDNEDGDDEAKNGTKDEDDEDDEAKNGTKDEDDEDEKEEDNEDENADDNEDEKADDNEAVEGDGVEEEAPA